MIEWIVGALSFGFSVFLLMERRIRARDEQIRELEQLVDVLHQKLCKSGQRLDPWKRKRSFS